MEIFGDSVPTWAKFLIAFAVVLALIGLTAALVRRFGANRLGGASARGRQPRLAVIDASPVDSRRRLVLIRRDNVEHLLMIGGPTDVVVEQNIVRGAAASTGREPARTEPAVLPTALREPAVREPSVRQSDNAWPLQPAGEPTPVAPPRTYRAAPAATEEPWLAPEPGARPRPADAPNLTGLAAELSAKLTPPEVTPPKPVRAEPPVVRANPPAPAAPPVVVPEPVAVQPQDDHNLAEMAQQLEAALRRAPAPAPEPRPPVTDALAATPKSPVPTRDYKLRIDPKFEARPDVKFDARPEPTFEPRVEAKPEPKADFRAEPTFELPPEPRPQHGPAGKNVFDNLEEEMASLLGRPPGKT
ncbi:MAG: flagellar biosynthetic protein FliO [Pseudolabrys sp.]|nr:flagellar biosynthetic protein FliO [Pseudolabrys sp.]